MKMRTFSIEIVPEITCLVPPDIDTGESTALIDYCYFGTDLMHVSSSCDIDLVPTMNCNYDARVVIGTPVRFIEKALRIALNHIRNGLALGCDIIAENGAFIAINRSEEIYKTIGDCNETRKLFKSIRDNVRSTVGLCGLLEEPRCKGFDFVPDEL